MSYAGMVLREDSIGYALTNPEYELVRKTRPGDQEMHTFIGMTSFDKAVDVTKRTQFRRNHRNSFRRGFRKREIRKIMGPDVLKKDPDFFTKLDEFYLYDEDKTVHGKNGFVLFDDESFNDKDYGRMYPTLYHLDLAIMNGEAPQDERLYFLALNHLLKKRGHFNLDVSVENVDKIADVDNVWDQFSRDCEEYLGLTFPESIGESIFAILIMKGKPTEKKERIISVLADYAEDKKAQAKIEALAALLVGASSNLQKLFDDDSFKGLKISYKAIDFENPESTHELELGNNFDLIESGKALFDLGALKKILKDYSTISEAQIAVYNKYKEDLRMLKALIRKYDNENHDMYRMFFILSAPKLANYVSYSGHATVKNDRNDPNAAEKNMIAYPLGGYPEFTKFVKEKLNALKITDEADIKIRQNILDRMNEEDFLVKPKRKANSIIPYQLVYKEFDCILKKAEEFMPCLHEIDESGLTGADRLRQLFQFTIPYYMGPLTTKDKSPHAWLVKKEDGNIRPWNYKDVVDIPATETAFIEALVGYCSYIAGEKVLPKESMTYQKFMVLDELSHLKVNGVKLTPEVMHKVYNDFFIESSSPASEAALTSYFAKALGLSKKEITISGLAKKKIENTLKTYHKFKSYLQSGELTEMEVNSIVRQFTIFSDGKEKKIKWLEENFTTLSHEAITRIATLNFKGWGKLSDTLLTFVVTDDIEGKTVLDTMYEYNCSLQEAIHNFPDTMKNISALNNAFLLDHPEERAFGQRLDRKYIPKNRQRELWRAKKIFTELSSVASIDKFFIAYNSPNMENVAMRRANRMKTAEKAVSKMPALQERLKQLPYEEIDNDAVYLYFIQQGRCAYSNEVIDYDMLRKKGRGGYSVEHIYPESISYDNSIDNKVLVVDELNKEKQDTYPIKKEIREEMEPVWKKWRGEELISEKKLERLVRSEPLTDEERAEFITHFIGNPSRAAKTFGDIIKEYNPDLDIVYVDTELIQQFRFKYGFHTHRSTSNDVVGTDAYLAIILGNIMDVTFTRNPLNFVREQRRRKQVERTYTLNLDSILAQRVSRGSVVAWDPQSSLETVKSVMSNEKVYRTYFSYFKNSSKNGGFYDTNPLKKRAGTNLVPKKTKDSRYDPDKYGGYNSKGTRGFALIEGVFKKVKGRYIVPISLYDLATHNDTPEGIVEICESMGFSEARLLRKNLLKANTVVYYNGAKMYICGKTSNYITLRPVEHLPYSEEMLNYADKIVRVYRKIDMCNKRKVNDPENPDKKITVPYFIVEKDGIDAAMTKKFMLNMKKMMTHPLSPFYDVYSNYGEWFERIVEHWDDFSENQHITILYELINGTNPDNKEFAHLREYLECPAQRYVRPMRIDNVDIIICNESATGYFTNMLDPNELR